MRIVRKLGSAVGALAGVTLAAVALVAAAASAQDAPGRFAVMPRGGYLRFDRATSIEPNAALGLDAMYALTRNFSIGTGLTFSRPQTRGEDFIAQISFGDTTFLLKVTQPITIVDANVGAMLRLPGRLTPYLLGAIGQYVMYLDPQVNSGSKKFTHTSGTLGGGFLYHVTDVTGLQLDLRDLIFTKYDRERLRPTQARFANTRFPEDVPTLPASKATVHNLMVSLGFSFTPARPVAEGQP
ncbi:MAG: outer membrane beta-barrel protein [Gemmatimonadota bacterium]|nr:outer membrane beta-barrel protein [Gemmatimonadota bacterium]